MPRSPRQMSDDPLFKIFDGRIPQIATKAEVDAIAARLEDDTGRVVDRATLTTEINLSVAWVAVLGFYKAPRPNWDKKMAEGWAASRQMLAILRRSRPVLIKAIVALWALALEEPSGRVVGPESVVPLVKVLEAVDRADGPLERHVAKFRLPCGRPEKWDQQAIVEKLAGSYHRLTGQRATTSFLRSSSDRGGPFVAFVNDVLDIAEPGRNHAGLGTAVENALRQLRKKNQASKGT